MYKEMARKMFDENKKAWEPPKPPPMDDQHPNFECTEREIHLNLGWDDSIHVYYARVSFPDGETTKVMFKKLERAVRHYPDLERRVIFLRLVNQFNKVQIEVSDIRLFRILSGLWTRDPSVYCGYIEMKNDDYYIRKWLVRSPLRR